MNDLNCVLKFENDRNSAVSSKNERLKKRILAYLTSTEDITIAELARNLDISVPTVTKLVIDLRAAGLLKGNGKIETSGGRRPNVFGIAPEALYFMGVDVRSTLANLLLMDFSGQVVASRMNVPFELTDTAAALERICREILDFAASTAVPADRLVGVGFGFPGYVDSRNGIAYGCFDKVSHPLQVLLEDRLGMPVRLENDSRAMLFAEQETGKVGTEKDILFLNIGRGVGAAFMFDGRLYSGKSGLAGEFGHIPLFDNELLCHCGKKGCLETEVSGEALEHEFLKHMEKGETSILSDKWKAEGKVGLADIIGAANKGDVLSLALIADMSDKLGRGVGILVTLLNPGMVVVGGCFSSCGENLMLPLKAGVNRFSSTLTGKATAFKLSELGEQGCALGAAMLLRARLLDAD